MAFDFDFEGNAEESSNCNNSGQHTEALEGRRDGNGAYDVCRHKELQAEKNTTPEIGPIVTAVAIMAPPTITATPTVSRPIASQCRTWIIQDRTSMRIPTTKTPFGDLTDLLIHI